MRKITNGNNMKKRNIYIAAALIIITSIALLSYLAIVYVNRTLIPVTLKGILEKNLSDYTGHKVDIGKLNFSMSKGFILKAIEVYKNQGDKKETLFKAEGMSFAVIFIPSFKEINIMIPRINIDKPYILLERYKDGSWNISDIIKKKPQEKKPSRFVFTLKGISLNNGEILLKDNYAEIGLDKKIILASADIGLSLPDSISLSCNGNIDSTKINIKARYKLLSKEILAELEAKELALAEYWNDYLGNLPISLSAGSCNCSVKIHMIDFNKTKVYGDIALKGLSASFKDMDISGNYSLSGDASFNVKEPLEPSYDLKLELDNAKIITTIKQLESIDNIKGALSLSEKQWTTKNLSCLLNNSPVTISGVVNSPGQDLTADIDLSSTLRLKDISDAVKITFESGEAVIETHIKYQHKDKNYNVSGTSNIKSLRLRQNDIIISGNFSITGESQGTVGNWESLQYKGQMSFDTASIEGMGLMPLVSNARGEAEFSTKNIKIKRFRGDTAGTSINLSGSLDYLGKEPKLDLDLITDELSIGKLINALPEKIKSRFKDIDANGICSVNVTVSGTLGRQETFNYNGRLLLKDASVILPYWPNNISSINSDILFEKQRLTWKRLDFNIKDTRYYSNGELIDFAQPKISLNLKSDDFNLLAEVNIDKSQKIQIQKCSGAFRSSTFLLEGEISDLKSAIAQLNGTLQLELKDTPYIFKAKKDILEKLKPEGGLKLTFNMSGPLKNFKDCSLTAEGTSKTISLWGLKLKDFYFNCNMKDNFIDMPVIAAYPYGGVININLRANLKAEERPYLINIDMKDIDLNELVKDTEMKNKSIKGAFAAKAVLNGYLNKKDSLYGSGWLQVSDGYLWEFPVMRGMMDIIFMMPPEYLTLTDAFGNFSVKDGRIHTEDFKLLSKSASLLWVGSLGFDTTLDFSVTGRFAEDVIKKTTEPGRIAGAILSEAGSLIMEARLTGTLAKPKYQIVPFPVKRILQENVVNKVKDIFGGVF